LKPPFFVNEQESGKERGKGLECCFLAAEVSDRPDPAFESWPSGTLAEAGRSSRRKSV
jgi:hypothetical protein